MEDESEVEVESAIPANQGMVTWMTFDDMAHTEHQGEPALPSFNCLEEQFLFGNISLTYIFLHLSNILLRHNHVEPNSVSAWPGPGPGRDRVGDDRPW